MPQKLIKRVITEEYVEDAHHDRDEVEGLDDEEFDDEAEEAEEEHAPRSRAKGSRK